MDYERQRLEDTGLRPNRFVQRLREEPPLPDYQAMAFRGEELPPSFQPVEPPLEMQAAPFIQAQQAADAERFAGMTPEESLARLSAEADFLQPGPIQDLGLQMAEPGSEERFRLALQQNQLTLPQYETGMANLQAAGFGPEVEPLAGGVMRSLEPQPVPFGPQAGRATLQAQGLPPQGFGAGPVQGDPLESLLGQQYTDIRERGRRLDQAVELASYLTVPTTAAITGLETGRQLLEGDVPAAAGELALGSGVDVGLLGAPKVLKVGGETLQKRRAAQTAEAVVPEAAQPAVREAAEELPAAAGGSPTAVEKLTNILKQTTRPARREQDRLRSEELRKRVAAGARIMEEGGGEETYIRAVKQLEGEFPKVGAAPREQLGPDDITELYSLVNEAEGQLFLTRITAANGLTKVLAGEAPGMAQIKVMEKFFGGEMTKPLREEMSLGKKIVTGTLSTANAIRAVQTAFDLSAPFRQGILLIGHPKEFFGNMAPMVKAFGSDEFYETGMRQLATGPEAERRAAAGLFQADITLPRGEGGGLRGELAAMSAREEPFMSSLVERIPGVRRSQHAYVYYLNKLRADVFDNTVAGWDRLGIATADMEQDLAKMLNVFSGRGELGAIDDFVPVLNQAFFSARLLASRPQAPTFLFRGSKHVRYLAAKDLASFVGFGFSMLGMAALGAEAYEKSTGKKAPFSVEHDWRSTDFGKIKVGPTRLDFWGGFQPIARYAGQIMTGERKTGGGDIIDAERMASFGRFLRSKLSPQAGFGVDVATGETFMGDEMSTDPSSIKEQAYNRLTPLFIQDFADAVREGNGASPFMTIPAAFGASAMTYRTFTEETAAKIAEAFETGKLDAARYDPDKPLPTRMSALLPTDKDAFRALYPEVQEQIEEFERGTDERSQFFAQTETGKETLHTGLDRIEQTARTGTFGNMDEQEGKTSFWDAVGKLEDQYAGVVINAGAQFPDVPEGLSETGTNAPTARLIKEYRALQDRHPIRETDEQWEAYEQDLNRNFTKHQLSLVRRELDVGDHRIQQVWTGLNDTIGDAGYYDVPEGRAQSRRREIMRRQNPELDAALYLLGRVSRVFTSRARGIVTQRTQEIWGGGGTTGGLPTALDILRGQ
jgi:hypothetical protein